MPDFSHTLNLVGIVHPAGRGFHLERMWSSVHLPFLCQLGFFKIGYERFFLLEILAFSPFPSASLGQKNIKLISIISLEKHTTENAEEWRGELGEDCSAADLPYFR